MSANSKLWVTVGPNTREALERLALDLDLPVTDLHRVLLAEALKARGAINSQQLSATLSNSRQPAPDDAGSVAVDCRHPLATPVNLARGGGAATPGNDQQPPATAGNVRSQPATAPAPLPPAPPIPARESVSLKTHTLTATRDEDLDAEIDRCHRETFALYPEHRRGSEAQAARIVLELFRSGWIRPDAAPAEPEDDRSLTVSQWLDRLRSWIASEQWRRGIIPKLSTYAEQQTFRSEPPAPIAALSTRRTAGAPGAKSSRPKFDPLAGERP